MQTALDGKTVRTVSGHYSPAVMVDATSYKLHDALPTGKDPVRILLPLAGEAAYTTNTGENTVMTIALASP